MVFAFVLGGLFVRCCIISRHTSSTSRFRSSTRIDGFESVMIIIFGLHLLLSTRTIAPLMVDADLGVQTELLRKCDRHRLPPGDVGEVAERSGRGCGRSRVKSPNTRGCSLTGMMRENVLWHGVGVAGAREAVGCAARGGVMMIS